MSSFSKCHILNKVYKWSNSFGQLSHLVWRISVARRSRAKKGCGFHACFMPGKFSKVQLNLSHQAEDETKYVDVPYLFGCCLSFQKPLKLWKATVLKNTTTSPGMAPRVFGLCVLCAKLALLQNQRGICDLLVAWRTFKKIWFVLDHAHFSASCFISFLDSWNGTDSTGRSTTRRDT